MLCGPNLEWRYDHAMHLASYAPMLIWKEEFARSLENSTKRGESLPSKELMDALVDILANVVTELEGVEPDYAACNKK